MTDTASDVARLATLAGELGVAAEQLDEVVYDLANGVAAQDYNDQALPELSDDDAYDAVHDMADAQASNINNGGLTAQVAYLVEQVGVEATERELRSVAG